jgi:hypothetical protein
MARKKRASGAANMIKALKAKGVPHKVAKQIVAAGHRKAFAIMHGQTIDAVSRRPCNGHS